MSVYVITGVSSGIGFELLRQLSANPSNLIIGLVRNPTATQAKITQDIGSDRKNIHILPADLTNYATLVQAAKDTAPLVGSRGVDYLIANAGFPSFFDAFSPISQLGSQPDLLSSTAAELFATNVTGNVHLINLFLPLILQGRVKKIIAISSGHADLDLINELDVENSALYAASKAALNVVVAKFSAEYKKQGVLVVAMSPGVVDVGHFNELTPEQTQGLMGFMQKIQIYAPEFKGPIQVDEAVKVMLKTWERLSVEEGFGGKFISQHGDKRWI